MWCFFRTHTVMLQDPPTGTEFQLQLVPSYVTLRLEGGLAQFGTQVGRLAQVLFPRQLPLNHGSLAL